MSLLGLIGFGQKSETVNMSDITNSSVTDVLINNSQNCSQNNSQLQTLNISNINTRGTGCTIKFNNISQTSVQAPNFSCVGNSQNSTDIVNKIKDKLKQKAESKAEGVGINNDVISRNVNKITNAIKNNVNFSNVQQCLQNNFNSQNMFIDNINAGCPTICKNRNCNYPGCIQELAKACTISFENINQKALQKPVSSCIMKNKNVAKAVTNAQTEIDQASKSISTGIPSAISSIVSGSVSMIVCGLFIIFAPQILESGANAARAAKGF